MTFVDRIADARDISDVFDLVNEFLHALHHSGAMDQIPAPMRPGRIGSADDLSYSLKLVSDEIKRREATQQETPDMIFGLHAVLDTALQKLRSGWYH
jgi:hypothetical protein